MPEQHLDEFTVPPPEMTEAERFLALQIRSMGNLVGTRLSSIDTRLAQMNGSVARVTAQAAEHETKIAVLETTCVAMAKAADVARNVKASEVAAEVEAEAEAAANTSPLKEAFTAFGPLIAAIAAILMALASLLSNGSIPLGQGGG